ncbi:MAG: hypothetical protein JWP38_3602 [Herbaspirillum sp.]|nr:hypothetical protein [Herbaspirillum sp.]
MKKRLLAVLIAVLTASTLAGCIVVPLGDGGGGYRHHRGYYD